MESFYGLRGFAVCVRLSGLRRRTHCNSFGDALDNSELRKLFEWLLNDTDGRLREEAANLRSDGGRSVEAADLSRAELMQLILMCHNDELITGIDSLVGTQAIMVPSGEVRTPVVNYAIRFGRHGLRAELGPHGIRVRSTGPSIAPLRAKRLVEQMYRMEDEADREELDWQLRDEASDSLEAKLEHYLQTRPPKDAIGNLVLARRSNVVVATTGLGLGDLARRGDEALIDAVLWKLGFSIRSSGQIHDDFWRAHELMLHQARRGIMTASPADRQDIRGAAANYFTALEKLLDDSLAYTVWALCRDHHSSKKPYVYQPHIDRLESFKLLNNFDHGDTNGIKLSQKNTLFHLTRAFARLEAYLTECEARMDDYLRPSAEVPDWAEVQSLERFPFRHKMTFLDLLPDCRESIKRMLSEITNRFVDGDISQTRNDWLHGQRSVSAASLDRLREGLEDAREAVLSIEENGFSRQLFWRVSDIVDGDQRRIITLANSVGRQMQLFGPSPFSWLRLPAWDEPQYVMNAARFAEPAECLRFTAEVESPYSKMWQDYPKRPSLQRGRGGQPSLPATGGTDIPKRHRSTFLA